MADPSVSSNDWIRWLEDITADDISQVGGKNSSLGEMITTLSDQGIRVPRGFAITTEAYRRFLDHNQIDEEIHNRIRRFEGGEAQLSSTGKALRGLIRNGSFPEEIAQAIRDAYSQLSAHYDNGETDVA